MQADRYRELAALGGAVQVLLLQQDAKRLHVRIKPRGATIGEVIALALLELDRISYEPHGTGALPAFASDFLDRRLAKRLLDRIPAERLPSEFDRRFAAAWDGMAKNAGEGEDAVLERLVRLLSGLRSALLQPEH